MSQLTELKNSIKDLSFKDWMIFTGGFILYLNYRMVYFFTVYKEVESFKKFSMSPDNRCIAVIVTVDLSIVFYLWLGVWWMLIIWTVVLILNFGIDLGYKLYKRLQKK